jgi:hypothetical protein
MKRNHLKATVLVALSLVSFCFGFTIDTTSRYSTGPVTFSKDTVFDIRFVALVGAGDFLKIKNYTNDTVFVGVTECYWDTTKTKYWGITLGVSPRNAGDWRTYFQFDQTMFVPELPIVGILKNDSVFLNDFTLDLSNVYPVVAKTRAQSRSLLKYGDTMIVNMVFMVYIKETQATLEDTVTLIGINGHYTGIKNQAKVQPISNKEDNAATVYSITGKKVGVLSSGAYGRKALSPGVYIIKSANSQKRKIIPATNNCVWR